MLRVTRKLLKMLIIDLKKMNVISDIIIKEKFHRTSYDEHQMNIIKFTYFDKQRETI